MVNPATQRIADGPVLKIPFELAIAFGPLLRNLFVLRLAYMPVLKIPVMHWIAHGPVLTNLFVHRVGK